MAHRSKISVEITPETYIAAAVILLLVPLDWMCAWVVAAVTHECCHCLAILICRSRIEKIYIGLNGARIQAFAMNPWKQLFSTLAGPCGALLLLLLGPLFPRLAICAFIQSIYNLLPVLPLDGGHALQCVLTTVFPETLVYRILKWEEIVFFLAVLLLSITAAIFLKLGFAPVAIICCMLLWLKIINIPCKSRFHRVQ